MKAVIESVAKTAEQKQYDDTIRLYSDLLTAMFDKATAYMNVITLGGYAAFFGLWTLLGDFITPKQKLWAGLLIGASVLLFVAYEIVKIAVFHWQVRTMYSITKAKKESLQVQIAKYERAAKATTLAGVALWVFVFPLTILFGVLGAGILLVAFFQKAIA